MTSQRAIVSNEQLLNTLLADLGGNPGEKGGLDLQAYLQVVLKYKWGILAFTALVTLLSTIYVSTLVPLYRAEATLLFDPPSGNNYGTVRDQSAMVSLSSGVDGPGRGGEAAATVFSGDDAHERQV